MQKTAENESVCSYVFKIRDDILQIGEYRSFFFRGRTPGGKNQQERRSFLIVPGYFEDLSVLHENTLDHRMAGIGSKSCGPDLSEQYRIDEDTYRFAFLIRPERV